MILKPFMLRRIKKDVENELSDKVSKEDLMCLSIIRHQLKIPGGEICWYMFSWKVCLKEEVQICMDQRELKMRQIIEENNIFFSFSFNAFY